MKSAETLGQKEGRRHAVDEARDPHAMTPEQQKELIVLLKEARSIIRASSSRQLAKDWDNRVTQALKDAK